MGIGFMIEWAFRILLPKAPAWVSALFVQLVPAIVEFVQRAIEEKRLDPVETIETIRAMLDTSLDPIPGWSDAGEDRRDAIVGGLAQFALFLYEVIDGDGSKDIKPPKLRRKARLIGRDIKRSARDVVRARRSLRGDPGE